jgi:hypothetical protein
VGGRNASGAGLSSGVFPGLSPSSVGVTLTPGVGVRTELLATQSVLEKTIWCLGTGGNPCLGGSPQRDREGPCFAEHGELWIEAERLQEEGRQRKASLRTAKGAGRLWPGWL